jgi:hypothetical protein
MIFDIIEFIIINALLFAIPARILTSLGNSFCDSIIFSKANGKQDSIWHWVKYGIDRMFIGVFWFTSFPIIYRQCNYDVWHYTTEFLVWAATYLSGFFIWQINYSCWKKYWNGKYK